jgi:hypothetical protein
MRDDVGRYSLTPGLFRITSAFCLVVALAAVFAVGFAPRAEALPSYARQTGQPCGSCHTDFAGLTPFGRLFKIQGYTAGGGAYRTTLFPSSEDPPSDDKKKWVPPVAMMAIAGFTTTQADQAPPTAPYNGNNNIVVSPISFFYGGAITDHIGAFAQVTYNALPLGGYGYDPFQHTWTWDNTDLRYADAVHIGRYNLIYGITANNNPTVQDPWNTTPAWGFPYAQSTVAPALGGASHPLINGAWAQHVASVGAYAMLDDFLYLEASVYHALDPNTQNSLGADPFTAPGLFAAAPYWRAAIEPHWGNHWLEVGTFGMITGVHPFTMGPPLPGSLPIGVVPAITTAVDPRTDTYTDIGFDTQYQYQGSNFWLTVRGTYVHEFQQLDATFFDLAGSTNPANTLNEARAYLSLAYGNSNRVVLTGQYFNTWGSSDPTLYAALASGFSPNTAGFIAEIAYIPFMNSQAPGWPWFNARIGLQYVGYTKYDGTTLGASANNTLFLYAWIAM